MLRTTVGQVLVNEALPPALRDYGRTLGPKEQQALFDRLAKEHPQEYRRALKALGDVGRHVFYRAGGLSPTLSSLKTSPRYRQLRQEIEAQVAQVQADPALAAEAKRAKIVKLLLGYQDRVQAAVYEDSLAEENPLGLQVLSGARGNKGQLTSLRGGDLLYTDHRDRAIPIPVTRNYGEGLSPAQYFAAAFGARKGIVDTKLSVADAGFFCLAAGTLVRTAKGATLPIESVRPGLLVVGAFEAADGSWYARPTRVVRAVRRGLKPCWRHVFHTDDDDGPAEIVLCATLEHKVLGQLGLGGAPAGPAVPQAVGLGGVGPGDEAAFWGFYLDFATTRPELTWTRAARLVDRLPLGEVETWDLEVEADNGLFALASGLVVSNSKQLRQIAHRLVVTARDTDDPDYARRGVPVDADDPDNEGALLAYPAGPYPRNTVLTPKVLAELRGRGVERLVIRSPLVGGPPEGGVYAADAGVRERGGLPPVGDFVGVAAADAVGEKVSQGGLCLAGDTLVRLADGTLKAVALVNPGEWVLGADRHGRTFPVQVLARHEPGRKLLRRYRFRVGESRDFVAVECSADHKFVPRPQAAPPEVRAVDPLAPGEDVLAVGVFGHGAGPLAVTLRQVERAARLEAYDLEVDHPEHLFVLASGLICSNSSKHAGGVAGAAKSVSGFAALNAMLQIPKTYKGGASHAQRDGRVTAVRPAPAGGTVVEVEGAAHYVPQGVEVYAKVGDEVEAGDVLSEGLPNPAEFTSHKGVGEGRRYFAQIFRRAMKDAGLSAHRRNLELLARGVINHVRLTDELGPWSPDDVVPYDVVEHAWRPRPEARAYAPRSAGGKYLERPVLHYTVGTPLKPSVVKELEHFGVQEVLAHDEPPPWAPEMIRGLDALQTDPDWVTRMLGSGLEKGFLDSVQRGRVSDAHGTSFAPGLVNPATLPRFGREGVLRSWDPPQSPPQRPATPGGGPRA
jgi:hypothetical protein